MADPKALEKLQGIDGKLAELMELGKQMQNIEDPALFAALQVRFKELARAFDEQVRGIQSAMVAAGMVKPQKFRIDLGAEEAGQVKARTGREVQFVELDEPPARALTREELIDLAVKKAKG